MKSYEIKSKLHAAYRAGYLLAVSYGFAGSEADFDKDSFSTDEATDLMRIDDETYDSEDR
jgi:hypothetical protein